MKELDETQKNVVLQCGLDLSGSGKGQLRSSCDHDNEFSDSINGGDFLDLLKSS
jgi:hypothetical protein